MKKNIIGLTVVVLALLGSEGLKAQNADCVSVEAMNENYGKNIKTCKKITLVNNLGEEVGFVIGLGDKTVEEYIKYEVFSVPAHSQQVIPYCLSLQVDAVVRDINEQLLEIRDINGWLLERDLYQPGKAFDRTKIKPLDLTDTFKKLQNKKSFNLVITINEVGKDPVVEIK